MIIIELKSECCKVDLPSFFLSFFLCIDIFGNRCHCHPRHHWCRRCLCRRPITQSTILTLFRFHLFSFEQQITQMLSMMKFLVLIIFKTFNPCFVSKTTLVYRWIPIKSKTKTNKKSRFLFNSVGSIRKSEFVRTCVVLYFGKTDPFPIFRYALTHITVLFWTSILHEFRMYRVK